jgi:hypothetical protein
MSCSPSIAALRDTQAYEVEFELKHYNIDI